MEKETGWFERETSPCMARDGESNGIARKQAKMFCQVQRLELDG